MKCLKKIKQCDIKNGKIIYFHTSSNLQLEQFKVLIEKCEKECVDLEIYNIDMIANLLRYKYPLIAKEYLGIEPDTLQLLSIDDFLQEYNSAPSSVKINKNLLYREAEQEKIINTATAVVLIAVSVVLVWIAIFYAAKVDYETGVYKCRKCGHTFKPTFRAYVWGAHTLTTRHLKCPECNEKSWCTRKKMK